jgi:hypothetical protein
MAEMLSTCLKYGNDITTFACPLHVMKVSDVYLDQANQELYHYLQLRPVLFVASMPSPPYR